MDRKPAAGFWRNASTILVAAKTLHWETPDDLYPVDYYLVGHSLKLGLKGYLFTRSLTLEKLKDKIGHDLNHLLLESMGLGLQGHVPLSPGQVKAIEVISPIYKGMELEYVEPGPKTLPDWGELLRLSADSLLTGIEAICRR